MPYAIQNISVVELSNSWTDIYENAYEECQTTQ